MYRVFALLGGGLLLAGCSSTSFDVFRSDPVPETVQFESEPAGAEVKTSTGQTCRTPCAIALPGGAPASVTFSLNGYQTATEQLDPTSMGDGTLRLRPNPVMVEMAAAPPSSRRAPPPRKKPAAKPKPRTTANPTATAPRAQAPAPGPGPSAASPWPTQPAPR